MAKDGCNLRTAFGGVLVVFILLVQGGSAGLYTCWGGCLNECFLLQSKQIGQRFPCYINCVAKCFYAPPGSTPAAATPPPPSAEAPAPSDTILDADSEAYVDSVIDVNSKNQDTSYRRNYCIMECSWQLCGLSHIGDSEMKKCLLGCMNRCKD